MNYPVERTSVSLSARLSSTFLPSELSALKQWQVQRHLGTGTTAHVWLLEHVTGRYSIACKTPKTPEDTTILVQEADLARTLHHENLVRILNPDESLGLSPSESAIGTYWEFLPAGSLGALVAAVGQLSVAQTVTVLLPMLQVTEYLHTHQIVHGDISPANILFDLDGRPVLIDLGAVRATAHAFHGTGTPGFVAPEVSTPGAVLDGLGNAADVYSLAAIGWFCLTGSIPGPPHSRMPLVALQPDIDREIAGVLEAALTAEPVLRPSLAQLLSAVASWAEPEPVDLHASVGEEYELLLPTRKPKARAPRRNRKPGRRRTNHNPEVIGGSLQETQQVSLRRRRLVLGLSSCVLLTGLAATIIYGQVTPSGPADGPSEELVVEDSVDFQAVVDTLAQARSEAWASSDVSQVQYYALKGTEVFTDDVQVLTSLQDTRTSLDGIRMRAVVEAVDREYKSAAVVVEWRTEAYDQRDGAQQVVETMQARTERLVLNVVETPDGWRLTSVQTV